MAKWKKNDWIVVAVVAVLGAFVIWGFLQPVSVTTSESDA
jgi:signal peptidase I